MTATSGPVSRSPAFVNSAAAASARNRHPAASRCSGESSAFRDERARPSGSRTIGQATTSTGSSRSETIRRITASCWASFSPK
jgi:hypothetical protein